MSTKNKKTAKSVPTLKPARKSVAAPAKTPAPVVGGKAPAKPTTATPAPIPTAPPAAPVVMGPEAPIVAKKAGTPAAAHPRDVTGAGFAFAVPRRQGTGVDGLGYAEGSRGNVLGRVLLALPPTDAGLTAKELTAVAGPLTRKGGATEDSIRAALSHMLHRAYIVHDGGRFALTHAARHLLTPTGK